MTLSPAVITTRSDVITLSARHAQPGDNGVDKHPTPVENLWAPVWGQRGTTGVVPGPRHCPVVAPPVVVHGATPIDQAQRASSTVSTPPSTAVLFNFSDYLFTTESPARSLDRSPAALKGGSW
ncbi:hypothetical protein acdb102_14840 [Acidothermaceae bacterium B102]|nr:hypothetical protein acdb102_14840 [Acidothermaceae bacterium B102]